LSRQFKNFSEQRDPGARILKARAENQNSPELK
jgi:hypothetical protein